MVNDKADKGEGATFVDSVEMAFEVAKDQVNKEVLVDPNDPTP